ncbi:hypothetical protein TNCT_682281 [Trichonephila clavata]|uniref:Uncharacterized protein n=1 Tax=Trichonephila clavata TaxID=2740835 RepID=A0A8X6KGB4_TRICU|nr:hypothetical protein TNCT_682281 [Trichonephila clavata]
MEAFSAHQRYHAVHGQVGRIALLVVALCCSSDVHGQVEGTGLLSKETSTVRKPIPLCPGDLKHCIVILKSITLLREERNCQDAVALTRSSHACPMDFWSSQLTEHIILLIP